MLYFKSLREAKDVLLALGQPIRIKIMEKLYQNDAMSISELAKDLEVTNGAISTHVAVLEKADLVRIKEVPARHGTTKLVSAKHDRLTVGLEEEFITNPFYTDSIKIGHYTNYEVNEKCGLATAKKLIGTVNDKRTFSFSERFEAGIVWTEKGYFEYMLPNHLRPKQRIRELLISFEISSFNEMTDDTLSDVKFWINQYFLGTYTCKGEEGGRKGYLAPGWWPDALNQYGELVTLQINSQGTFIQNKQKISEIRIDDMNIDYETLLNFRFEISNKVQNRGGFVLYGEKFGDYPQDIKIKVYYE